MNTAPLAIAIAIVLLTAAGMKVSVRDLRDVFERTPAQNLIRHMPARVALYGVAGVEVILAVALLTWRNSYLPALAAGLFFAVGTVYTGWALVAAPSSGCGCLGSTDPVTWKAPARAALMSALAFALVLGANSGGSDWLAALVAAAVLVSFRALSPELGWKRITGRARSLRYPRCIDSTQPVEWAIETLRQSRLWEQSASFLAPSEPDDFWRETCWRMLSFNGVYEGSDATYVFAVRLPPGPRVIRGAVVDASGQTLYAATEHLRRWPWQRPSSMVEQPGMRAALVSGTS